MLPHKIKLLFIFLVVALLTSCSHLKLPTKKMYKDPNKLHAFYVNMFISLYKFDSVQFENDTCYNSPSDFFKRKHENLDSISVIKNVLETMVVGGETNFMGNYLLSTKNGSSFSTMHHNRRVDFAILYYIYYDFYLMEDTSKFHNITIVNKKDSFSHCYPSGDTSSLYGSPSYSYEKEMYSDAMLSTLHKCYENWINEIELIGYAKSKQDNSNPFDKCSCSFNRIPDDKEHFSRFPRTK
jgi:hypothetical protein